ncbi:MAG: amidohydrolase [Candidatus Eremiobacteraeota bacterium]|nr:amidohydrolase [Candidatus Eremiobacteraeota bacterium]
MSLNKEIMKKTDKLFPFMQKIRRQIHMYPELGMNEFKTAQLIKDKLDEMGIPYRDKVANTGIVGLIEGKEPGKVLGIRADMDALPITEDSDKEYASKIEGAMHACGHDSHVAILLAAAKILNDYKDKFKGTVKLIFQPAEEGPGGAKPMIEEGALENPKVDRMVGLHVGSGIKTGLIGIKEGPTHASQDEIRITIKGYGGHAAYPHRSVDAIVIAAQVVMALQTIVSRIVDPAEPSVFTIGTIEGGYKHNIIADRVEMTGTIRFLNDDVGKMKREKIEKIVAGITKTFGGDYEFKVIRGYPTAINDVEFAREIKGYLTDLLGNDIVYDVEKSTMGAEDFAYFSRKVPSVFMRLGSGGENKEFSLPHHHSGFDVDEKAMINGCAAFVKIAMEYLK